MSKCATKNGSKWPTLMSAALGWAGIWNWIHIGGTHGWSPYLMSGLVGSGSLRAVHHLRKNSDFCKTDYVPLFPPPPPPLGGGILAQIGPPNLVRPLPSRPRNPSCLVGIDQVSNHCRGMISSLSPPFRFLESPPTVENTGVLLIFDG